MGDSRGKLFNLFRLGDVLHSFGDEKGFLDKYLESIDIAEKIGDPRIFISFLPGLDQYGPEKPQAKKMRSIVNNYINKIPLKERTRLRQLANDQKNVFHEGS
jgi:hypothetical protein